MYDIGKVESKNTKPMKYIIAILAVFSLSVSLASANGCGLGFAPRSRFPLEIKKLYTPPFFVAAEIDGDGKLEGRSDSIAMLRHDLCVAEKGL